MHTVTLHPIAQQEATTESSKAIEKKEHFKPSQATKNLPTTVPMSTSL